MREWNLNSRPCGKTSSIQLCQAVLPGTASISLFCPEWTPSLALGKHHTLRKKWRWIHQLLDSKQATNPECEFELQELWRLEGGMSGGGCPVPRVGQRKEQKGSGRVGKGWTVATSVKELPSQVRASHRQRHQGTSNPEVQRAQKVAKLLGPRPLFI